MEVEIVPRRWQILTVVSVAVFMASLDLFIVNIAFPDIAADFDGASVATMSWVLNAYAIVFAALLVPAGRLADRFGRRRSFLAGIALFVAGSALCGLAPSVDSLIAARVVQAAGAAIVMPTSLALLLPEFGPRERPAAIGVWAAVGGIAAAFGPPVGGLLVEASWRWVFWVNVPVGLVALLFAVRLLRESRDASQTRLPDLLGTALLAAAIALLALGLVKAPDWSWGDSRTLGCLVAAAVALLAVLMRCARHPSPVVELSMLRVRSFALANTAALLFTTAFAAMLLGTVLFLTGVWHESVLRAGVQIAPGPLMAAALAVPSGRLANRLGQRVLATAGCVLFALGGAWWLWQLDATPDWATEMLPGMIVGGAGVGMVLPSLASAVAASLPPTRFATGSAVLAMSRQIGSVLGVALLVAILGTVSATDPAADFDRAWILLVVAAGLAAVAALGIGQVRQHDAGPERAGADEAAAATQVVA
jgi:EmrB/QacA subfamily drug resistance transporter